MEIRLLKTLFYLPIFVLWISCSSAERLPNPKGYYKGELPCANCSGITYRLWLSGDSLYVLHQNYQSMSRPSAFLSFGTYLRQSANLTLATPDAPTRFRQTRTRKLSLLDPQGKSIESTLNYDLSPQNKVFLTEEPAQIHGLFRYYADTHLLRIPGFPKPLPFALNQDLRPLEGLHANRSPKTSTEIPLSIWGRVAILPNMEGRPNLSIILDSLITESQADESKQRSRQKKTGS